MIPVNEPLISAESKKYINDCLDTGWISSAGKYVTQFEERFAEYLGVKFATTVSNGTAALHLALESLGVGAGDEVIVPDLTIISCAFSVMYVGAKPVFVDVEKDTGNIDPSKIEAKITKKTKAIMVVHLFGHPVDMDPIMLLAKKYNLFVIEDAAEAHGAEYKGKKVGSIGDIATFSFYGNKIISTGEGGMVVTHNKELIDKARLIKDLAHKVGHRFYHERIGFNFRMTNLQAALGVGELLHVDEYIEKKIQMANMYSELLQDIPWIKTPIVKPYAKSVFWMYAIELKENAPLSRDEFMLKLKELGVDTRTYFYPLHIQPVVTDMYEQNEEYPVSDLLSRTGLYLPSGLAISEKQIKEVVKVIQLLG